MILTDGNFATIVLAGVIGLTAGAGEAFAAPLLATQILWINLVTDTFPALAMGVDPPDPDLMDRPPRPAGERVINGEMQAGIALVGLVMAAVTLLVLDLKLPRRPSRGTASLTEARTAAFTCSTTRCCGRPSPSPPCSRSSWCTCPS